MEDHSEGLAPTSEGRRKVETSLPLSPAQLGVYFEHLRDASGSRFNIGQVTTVAGDLDIERFRAAAAAVIAQTPALNLAIVTTDDQPRQVFVDRSQVAIPFHDLRDDPNPEAARAALLERLTFAPFDLARDPLFCWVLIKTRTGQTDWVQIYHHIVVDGWSGQLLAARVCAHFGDLVSPKADTIDIRSAPEPYATHLAEELAYQGSPAADRDGAYWRDLLANAEVAEPYSARHDTPGDPLFLRHRIVLEGALLDAVKAGAKACAVTPGQVVAAAAAVMEASAAQRSDIILSTPLLGRFGATARAVVSMSSNVGLLRIMDIWGHSMLRTTRNWRLVRIESHSPHITW